MNADNGKDVDPYAAAAAETPDGPPAGAEAEAWAAPEPGAPAAAEADAATAAALREAELEAEIARVNDRLLRALAEAENVRRRAERDKDDAIKYAIAAFAREIVTVGDNLGRALGAVPAEGRASDPALDTLAVGIEMTERNLHAVFERFGIKRVEALGQPFDPNLHEAMFEMEDATRPTGTVVQVVESGYLINDRLLRPAKVVVTRGGPAARTAGDAGRADSGAKAQQARGAQDAYDKPGPGAGEKLDQQL